METSRKRGRPRSDNGSSTGNDVVATPTKKRRILPPRGPGPTRIEIVYAKLYLVNNVEACRYIRVVRLAGTLFFDPHSVRLAVQALCGNTDGASRFDLSIMKAVGAVRMAEPPVKVAVLVQEHHLVPQALRLAFGISRLQGNHCLLQSRDMVLAYMDTLRAAFNFAPVIALDCPVERPPLIAAAKEEEEEENVSDAASDADDDPPFTREDIESKVTLNMTQHGAHLNAQVVAYISVLEKQAVTLRAQKTEYDETRVLLRLKTDEERTKVERQLLALDTAVATDTRAWTQEMGSFEQRNLQMQTRRDALRNRVLTIAEQIERDRLKKEISELCHTHTTRCMARDALRDTNTQARLLLVHRLDTLRAEQAPPLQQPEAVARLHTLQEKIQELYILRQALVDGIVAARATFGVTLAQRLHELTETAETKPRVAQVEETDAMDIDATSVLRPVEVQQQHLQHILLQQQPATADDEEIRCLVETGDD